MLLVDFEKKFIATHREGLKTLYADMQDPAKNGGKTIKLPDKDRSLKVHCTSVIDTESTKDIIHEGPLSGCLVERPLLTARAIDSAKLHIHWKYKVCENRVTVF
jgi:hypothetical protein